jgi:hypothetical protein
VNWKETIRSLPNLRYYAIVFFEMLMNAVKIFSQDSRSLDLDINPVLQKMKRERSSINGEGHRLLLIGS